QAEDVVDRTTDDPLGVEPGQLPGAPPGADEVAVLVADEERSVRRGVVVVEQLEQEAEAALGAAACLAAKSCVAVRRRAAVPAVGAHEMVGHRRGPKGRRPRAT